MDDSSRFLKEPAEVFDENNPKEILDLIREDTQAIIISEIQLVHPDIVRVVTSLQREGIYVICDGLNLDYTGEYFSLGLTNLISRATHPHSLYAICNFPGCGEAAYFSQKLNPDGTRPLMNRRGQRGWRSEITATNRAVLFITKFREDRSCKNIAPSAQCSKVP